MKRLVWLAFLLAFLFLALLLVILPAQAQTKSLIPVPRIQFLDTSGNPLADGHVHTYISLTTTNQATYTDSGGGTPNANPVLLDAGGFAGIWLTPTESYTIEVHNSSNVLQWSVDNVTSLLTTANTWSAAQTFPGSITATGSITAGRINEIRYVDGTEFTTIQLAHDDLPGTGGTVDGRPLQGAQTIGTTIAITKPTEILLDAATFTSSVTPAFSFDAGSDGSSLICTRATKITFANSIADFSRLIRITGTSNITIRGCELDGNGNNAAAGQQNHNIRITGSSTDILITQNVIHDAQGDGILIANAERVLVTENTFYNLGRQGVTLFGPTINDISVINNKFRVGTRVSTSTANGVFVDAESAVASGAGKNIIVSDNQMDGQGINFFSTGDPWSNVQINGNVIQATDTDSLNAAIEVKETQDFVIDSNVISGDVTVVRFGIRILDVTATVDTGRGVISNNTIRDMGNNAIALEDTISGDALGQIIIHGNIIENCAGVSVFLAADIPLVIFSNNILRNGDGANSIQIRNSNRFIVSGNILFDDGTTNGIVIDAFSGGNPRRGLIYGNYIGWTTASGKTAILTDSSADISQILIFGNDLADSATPLNIGALTVDVQSYMNRTTTTGPSVWTSDVTFDGVWSPLEGTLSNQPRWIFKQVDHTDMTASATAATFTLWTLPANTMIHDVVGTVVSAWAGTGPVSAAVCSVGTAAGGATDLALDDNFFATGTRYELHDATASGGKGSLLFDSTDKFAPFMLVASGDIEIQCDLTGGDHDNTSAGQARIYILVSQPLANTATEAN